MKIKNCILTLLLIAFVGSLQASHYGKKVQSYVDRGQDAYNHEQYVIAFDRFQKALSFERTESSQLEIKYLLGKTQMKLNHPKEAYLYYNDIWLNGRRDSLFLRDFGNAALIVGEYKTTIDVYTLLLKSQPQNIIYKNKLESAKLSEEKSKEISPLLASEIKAQSNIQSSFSEYGLSLKDGFLIYSSTARDKAGLMDPRTAQGYSRLYSASYNRVSKEWENPVPLDLNISEQKSNVGAFSYDTARRIGYFMWYEKGHSGIYTSRNMGGTWDIPALFSVNDIGTNVGHPSISPDGNRLLFVTRGNASEGDADIWIVERKNAKVSTSSSSKRIKPLTPAQQAAADKKKRDAEKKAAELKKKQQAAAQKKAQTNSRQAAKQAPVIYEKEWGLPIKLGSLVNTPGKEVFPMWIDNQTFSFSSDGKIGYGGLDIFVAMFDSNATTIKSVYLIDPPINSSFDDYSLLLNKGFDEGFFVSNRYTAPGRTDDILSFPKKSGKIKICGCVLDSVTRDTVGDYKVMLKDVNTHKFDTITVTKKGNFCYESTKGANYNLIIKKEEYTANFQTVNFPPIINSIPILMSVTQNYYLSREEKIEIPEIPVWDSITNDRDSFDLDKDLFAQSDSSSTEDSHTKIQNNFETQDDLASISTTADSATSEISQDSETSTDSDDSWLTDKDLAASSKMEDTGNNERSFAPIALPVRDNGEQDLTKLMNDNMSPKEIIDVISKNREEQSVVDQRFVNDYKARINDPNRRNRLTVLPPDVKCDACDEKTKQKKAGEPFFVRSNDDKALITLKDNAGNVSYIDLAPNAAYGIQVSQIPTGGNAPSLPDNIQISDLRKTVITKDYVMYECIPKLSEIDEEHYINNLYFEYDKADLVNDAFRELDRMVIVAIKNPDMMFEIESHADERGSEEYNQKLTQRRLDSAISYISKKGFDLDRIVGKSYGKSKPLIKNAKTEAEHKLNRRTTFGLFNPEIKNELANMSYSLGENKPKDQEANIIFKVQVGAFRNPVEFPKTFFASLISLVPSTPFSYFFDNDGLYKYSFGDFKTVGEARKVADKLLITGKECYISAYYQGRRITVSEALSIVKHNKNK